MTNEIRGITKDIDKEADNILDETDNKKVDIILHNKVSEKFAPIIGSNRVNKYILPYEDKFYDLIFILDVCDFSRTYYEVLRNCRKKIIINRQKLPPTLITAQITAWLFSFPSPSTLS